MTEERVLDVTGDEPELIVDPSGGGQGVDDDIERMARERAEIERELEAREEKLERIGEFDHARCTKFERIDHSAYGRTIPKLQFTFQFPSGNTTVRTFDYKDEPRSVEKFLKAHDAESVTDMIGVKHACVRTDNGWELLDQQSVRPWTYYQYVTETGWLLNLYWPSFVLSAITLLTGGSVVELSGGSNRVAGFLSLVVVATIIYGVWRSGEYN